MIKIGDKVRILGTHYQARVIQILQDGFVEIEYSDGEKISIHISKIEKLYGRVV